MLPVIPPVDTNNFVKRTLKLLSESAPLSSQEVWDIIPYKTESSPNGKFPSKLISLIF